MGYAARRHTVINVEILIMPCLNSMRRHVLCAIQRLGQLFYININANYHP